MTTPPNTSGIMENMFTQMVTPEQVANGAKPVNAPVNSSTNNPPPVAFSPVIDTPPAPATPLTVTPPTPAPVTVAPKAPEPQLSGMQVETDFFTDEPQEPPPVDAAPVDEEPDMSDVPESPAAENFKKMREALKNDRKALKAREKELAKVQAERDDWATGKKIPDVLTAKDTRIQELEQYEVMVNGKLSTEYHELVVVPAAETKSEFTKLAENYGVSEDIRERLVATIVATENEKERNALITRYFPDAIGATKAKELVTKMHELGQTAIDMEKKPAETHQTLQAKYQEKMQTEAEERAGIFEHVSKNAWNAAIEKTSSEKIYSNLILDPTNPEHNKIAEKNQHRAAIQFGALVKELHKAGMKNLPEKVAVGMARAIQLSIGGVDAYRELQRVQAELSEIKNSSSVMTTYMRPSPNGNGHSAPAARTPDAGPRTPQEAAQRAVINFGK